MTTRLETLRAAAAVAEALPTLDKDVLTVEETDAEYAALSRALGSGFAGAGTASLTPEEIAALRSNPAYLP